MRPVAGDFADGKIRRRNSSPCAEPLTGGVRDPPLCLCVYMGVHLRGGSSV